jgi:hypothetical protein
VPIGQEEHQGVAVAVAVLLGRLDPVQLARNDFLKARGIAQQRPPTSLPRTREVLVRQVLGAIAQFDFGVVEDEAIKNCRPVSSPAGSLARSCATSITDSRPGQRRDVAVVYRRLLRPQLCLGRIIPCAPSCRSPRRDEAKISLSVF